MAESPGLARLCGLFVVVLCILRLESTCVSACGNSAGRRFFGYGFGLTYVSYSLSVDRSPAQTWDDLFDAPRLRHFIQWHAARITAAAAAPGGRHRHAIRITALGRMTAEVFAMIAHQTKRPNAKALGEFCKKLPVPETMHQKTDPIHTVSFRELEDLGLHLLALARRPLRIRAEDRFPGAKRAVQCQTALLIRLWWRVPLRSRSMREMDIALPGAERSQPRLYKDHEGTWQLRYQGEQLKIGERRGRMNEFRVPFPPDLVPHLEEYLRDFRPHIPNADRDPHVFLGQTGAPLTQRTIWYRFSSTVFAYLNKRMYPHLLRTMWTDTYLLNSGGDIDTAAYMLNDNPTTVLKYYHELRADQQVLKAYAFNEAILGHGKANGKRTSR
jgi:Phage integrase family